MYDYLAGAQEAEQKGLINLFYFDESGFSQEPCVPYGWQEKGGQLRIPSVKGKRINVLGFMNRANDLFYYPVAGSVDSDTVLESFEDFATKMNEAVDPEAVAEAGFQATVHASKDSELILALEDSTTLGYKHSARIELGLVTWVGQKIPELKGFGLTLLCCWMQKRSELSALSINNAG